MLQQEEQQEEEEEKEEMVEKEEKEEKEEVKAGDVLQSNSQTLFQSFFAMLCIYIFPQNTSHTKQAL